jgi:two-component system LytT family sensor kinase
VSQASITYSKVLLAYAGWWIVWIGIQTLLLMKLGVGWQAALTDSAITQLVLAAAGYTINTSMRSYQPGLRNSFYVISWSIALAFICVMIQRYALTELNGSDVLYLGFLGQSLPLRGAFSWLMIVLMAVLTWFAVYVTERKENEKRREDAAELARNAELSNLRQQLQPHFLFNSLNSISALAGSQPEGARKMIQQLSDFLRGTVKKDNTSIVTLAEELDHLQLYLEIEKVRFGNRLATEVNKTEDSLAMTLPSLLLQPIVENAIKFGLYDTIGEINISISTRAENRMLVIQVTNPFDPATSVPQKGTGFGLSSVQRRLYLLYSRNDLLATSQVENIFTTTIRIPQSA